MRYSNFRSTYIPFEDEFFNSMDPDRSKITPEHKIYIIIQLELGPKNRYMNSIFRNNSFF